MPSPESSEPAKRIANQWSVDPRFSPPDYAPNNLFIDALQAFIIDPQLFRHVASQIGVDCVGLFHHLVKHLLPHRIQEVQRNRLFVAVKRLEVHIIFAFFERRGNVSCNVAFRSGVLDLDDFRAQVGQHERTKGSCAEL